MSFNEQRRQLDEAIDILVNSEDTDENRALANVASIIGHSFIQIAQELNEIKHELREANTQ